MFKRTAKLETPVFLYSTSISYYHITILLHFVNRTTMRSITIILISSLCLGLTCALIYTCPIAGDGPLEIAGKK